MPNLSFSSIGNIFTVFSKRVKKSAKGGKLLDQLFLRKTIAGKKKYADSLPIGNAIFCRDKSVINRLTTFTFDFFS